MTRKQRMLAATSLATAIYKMGMITSTHAEEYHGCEGCSGNCINGCEMTSTDTTCNLTCSSAAAHEEEVGGEVCSGCNLACTGTERMNGTCNAAEGNACNGGCTYWCSAESSPDEMTGTGGGGTSGSCEEGSCSGSCAGGCTSCQGCTGCTSCTPCTGKCTDACMGGCGEACTGCTDGCQLECSQCCYSNCGNGCADGCSASAMPPDVVGSIPPFSPFPVEQDWHERFPMMTEWQHQDWETSYSHMTLDEYAAMYGWSPVESENTENTL